LSFIQRPLTVGVCAKLLIRHKKARAARDALPFERPKLQATAITIDGSFADRLERAIRRSQPKLIEREVIEEDE
jgi:hypothetical protein